MLVVKKIDFLEDDSIRLEVESTHPEPVENSYRGARNRIAISYFDARVLRSVNQLEVDLKLIDGKKHDVQVAREKLDSLCDELDLILALAKGE